ncbi:MAG: hypothetical protein M3Q14_01010 [bacterium]|nr:hypothetical protein [bacterium]
MSDRIKSLASAFAVWFRDKALFFVAIAALLLLAIFSLSYAYRNEQAYINKHAKANKLAASQLDHYEQAAPIDDTNDSQDKPKKSAANTPVCENQHASGTGCQHVPTKHSEIKEICKELNEKIKNGSDQAALACQ